jgi:hypothetical protein
MRMVEPSQPGILYIVHEGDINEQKLNGNCNLRFRLQPLIYKWDHIRNHYYNPRTMYPSACTRHH